MKVEKAFFFLSEEILFKKVSYHGLDESRFHATFVRIMIHKISTKL